MEGIYQNIPRLYTALAEWAACAMYLLLLERRYSEKMTVILAVLALGVQAVLLVLTGDLPIIFWIPSMVTAVFFMYVFLYKSCRTTSMSAGYCCAKAFLLAEFAASLEWQLHTYLLAAGVRMEWLRFVLLAGVYFLVFGAVYCLEKPLQTREYLAQLSKREFFLAMMMVAFVFAFSNLSFVITESPFTSRIQADIFNIRTLVDLGGIAFLYAFQSRMCEYLAEKEVLAVQNVLKSQYEQYRSYQDSMELIHIKYHDLKHQIAGLRAETDKGRREGWIDAMERELDANEMSIDTGNQVLDTIFGAKLLQAKKSGVRMTCVIDGALLGFMHVTDICTIFGNALDNAMESVMMLPEPEKRLIHATVSSYRGFVYIEISNYCEQELDVAEGDLPKTTKSDRKNHGFGLKSVRYSVEKYKGNVTVGIKDNWFELKILLPKQ